VTVEAVFPQGGVSPDPEGGVSAHIGFLGRRARAGSWEQLARGTFGEASRAAGERRWETAAELVLITLDEAQELREIYEEWPGEILEWIKAQGGSEEEIRGEQDRLAALLGDRAMRGIEAAWPEYRAAAEAAAASCRREEPGAAGLIEAARKSWMVMHDEAVDRLSGLIDIAVRILGEHRLGDLWDRLLADWYEVHARRYDLENQPWEVSAHQLMISIVDGFHAHLAGSARQGDIELIHEPDRIGFRFAPCGSGGRFVDPGITEGRPRAGHPFDFAVTTERHDWAWNTEGICSYCVHCCLLNEVMPIDRLGYPTRVIDPPVWTGGGEPTSCTWWVYRHPSLVPDEVYARVGRSPERRPAGPIRTESPTTEEKR
jgi:hypothetical protein